MLNHFGSILLADSMLEGLGGIIIIAVLIFIFGMIAFLARTYKKVPPGQALVRTGVGQTKVVFDGGFVFPVLHQHEMMDISVRSIEIQREGKNGLICKDNLRADIKVAFFVRVNPEDVKEVAQSIGCSRASDEQLLETLFEAKFSEGLKTVGKQFDFVELYTSREELNKQVRAAIGTQLNGYILEDMAIDYLEQTPLEFLDANNILDSEGIKKITDLTANQKIQSNLIRNDEIKQIKQQDVERQEAVYELERQQAEAQAKQLREISIVQSREEAESEKVRQEERLKSERARITAEEEMGIAEENKSRQIIVAQKSKETTEAVETEKVERERALEINERERVVELARISKEKAVEEERRNIQDVIRERVEVERAVVEEEEKIKDTKAFSAVEREKT
ncbi:MAG: putative membrane protein YqiK, partial [Flammeovirgaceae bacterium]